MNIILMVDITYCCIYCISKIEYFSKNNYYELCNHT